VLFSISEGPVSLLLAGLLEAQHACRYCIYSVV